MDVDESETGRRRVDMKMTSAAKVGMGAISVSAHISTALVADSTNELFCLVIFDQLNSMATTQLS